jgi:hypothetical protein
VPHGETGGCKEEAGGVSPDVSDIQRRRLEASGWELVEFRSGKSLWRRPGGGRLYTLKSALKHANRQERGELEAAGWKGVEGDRETFWRRPDTSDTSTRKRRR